MQLLHPHIIKNKEFTMKSKRINELAFFAKPADCLAKELIGMNIHLNNDAGNKISFKITD